MDWIFQARRVAMRVGLTRVCWFRVVEQLSTVPIGILRMRWRSTYEALSEARSGPIVAQMSAMVMLKGVLPVDMMKSSLMTA